MGEVLALQQRITFPAGNRGARLTSWAFKATVIFPDKFCSTKLSFYGEDSIGLHRFDRHSSHFQLDEYTLKLVF